MSGATGVTTPDRSDVLDGLASLIGDDRPDTGGRPDLAVAACVVAVDGHDAMRELDEAGTDAAMGELSRRLDRLVRANDVLGRVGEDRLCLGVRIAPGSAGVLVERVIGAAAMPIELGGDVVSLGVTVGVAFDEGAGPAADRAGRLLAAAEHDVERRRARGR